MTAFLTIFQRFPTTFRRFPKIFQDCSEGQRNVPEHFPWISENCRRCPKISYDSWRLLRKTRRCFDDTPTNLSTTKETNLISVKSSISTHVKISYLHMWRYIFACEDTVSILSICYHSVCHWLLSQYNNSDYLFLWSWAGGILRILQSDWFRERAVFSYLLTTVTVTAGNSAGEIVMFG